MKKSLVAQSNLDQINCKLFWAIEDANLDEVVELINSGAQLIAQDKDKYTPLHLAVREGNLEIIELLLSRKANVNSVGGRHNMPPLYYTMDVNVVQQLIAAHANVNDKDQHGDTLLHFAVICRDIEMMRLLLANKANINAQNQYGETPLHFAPDFQEIAQSLITNCADINIQNDQNHTPLDSIQKTIEITQVLLGLEE